MTYFNLFEAAACMTSIQFNHRTRSHFVTSRKAINVISKQKLNHDIVASLKITQLENFAQVDMGIVVFMTF